MPREVIWKGFFYDALKLRPHFGVLLFVKWPGEIWGRCWENPDRHHWTHPLNKGFIMEPKVPVDPEPRVSGVGLPSVTAEPLVSPWVPLVCLWLGVGFQHHLRYSSSQSGVMAPEWGSGKFWTRSWAWWKFHFVPCLFCCLGVARSYWSVKWGCSQEREFGSCCVRVWVEINYLYTLEGCIGF